MSELISSFGRALASLLHPRLMWLICWPLLLTGVLWLLLLGFAWHGVVDWVERELTSLAGTANTLAQMFDISGESSPGDFGLSAVSHIVAPVLVVLLWLLLMALSSPILVAILAMPTAVRYLGENRFAALEQRHGGGWWSSLGHSLWLSVVFLLLTLLTLPLWLFPPLAVLLPVLLFGWLAYRIMSYDAFALHASPAERQELMRRHRWPLLALGIITAIASTLPMALLPLSLVWIFLLPVIAALVVWLYVVVFIFSALWFAHYCLQALQDLRRHEFQAVAKPRLIE